MASGRAAAATSVEAEIGFASGVPQKAQLTDPWTGAEYQAVVVADQDAHGGLALARLVVTRAENQRSLIARPHVLRLQDGHFAAVDFAKGPGSPAFWDRRIPIAKDSVLVVRVEDAQVRALPGAPVGQVGTEEIVSLRLHIFLDSPTPPQTTPKAFVTEQYGLTFRTPPHSTYCELPADWEGADHGTVIFLVPPKRCFGAGYPSSGRGFSEDPPRVEVFYGYDLSDDEADPKPLPCKEIARVTFLNSLRPLCKARGRHGVEVAVTAKYMADSAAEASLTLLTLRIPTMPPTHSDMMPPSVAG